MVQLLCITSGGAVDYMVLPRPVVLEVQPVMEQHDDHVNPVTNSHQARGRTTVEGSCGIALRHVGHTH